VKSNKDTRLVLVGESRIGKSTACCQLIGQLWIGRRRIWVWIGNGNELTLGRPPQGSVNGDIPDTNVDQPGHLPGCLLIVGGKILSIQDR
jgi:septin family protein